MEEHNIKKELGLLIRRRRKHLGLSQEALAARADLHRTYVTDIERGTRNISIESIYKLTAALDTSIGALFSSSALAGDANGGDALKKVEPVEILLVEDDPKDVEMTLEAFRHAKLTNRVHIVDDGASALDFLFCRGQHQTRVSEGLPHVVLLDLGLPKVHGLEVLRQIKGNERTRGIKVVVLSASRSDKQVQEAIRLGASGYIFKPVDFVRFSEVTPELDFYWTLRKAGGVSVSRV
jgi:two-component system response regulator